VRCPTCGTELGDEARPHACQRPSEWVSATRRLVAFAAFFAAAAIASAVLAHSLSALTEAGAEGDPAATAGLTLGAILSGLLAVGSILGLIVAFVFWWREAYHLGLEHGAPKYGHLGYWGGGFLLAAFAASFIVPGRLDSTGQGLLLQAGLRVAGVLALIAGVLHTNVWARALTDGENPMALTAEDWDASAWDPAVQREIERRRERW
jgi:hypothetical protein